MMRKELQDAKRIVIKVGSSSLTLDTGRLDIEKIEQLVRQIAHLVNMGKEVILVSSGAVAAGIPVLGLKEKPKDIPTKQAAAAVGQGILLQMYEKLFREYGIIVGQLLLTRDDSNVKKRYINLRNTLQTLLTMGVVPIINENDVVAVDEVKIGDNDTLSAMVASTIEADILILLSDIEGLYTANPQVDPLATLIPKVEYITEEVLKRAGGAGSNRGTGGMKTKLDAAQIAMHSGCHMIIALGSRKHVLWDIIKGEEVGTWFKALPIKPHMRKRWLAFGTRLTGKIFVDAGCAKALIENGSSLLAVGITAVEGVFQEGDTVSVFLDTLEIARGIVHFSSEEIQRIQGKKMDEIFHILDTNSTYYEVIHRDNLVIL